MSNKNRWKYGDTKPVVGAAGHAVAIHIGDLVYQEEVSGAWNIEPASAAPKEGNLAQQQEYFCCRFLGHASEQFRADQTPKDLCELRVNARGVHEYDCVALTHTMGLGTFFGPAGAGAQPAAGLLNQTVVEGAEERRAVGRLARRVAVGDKTVYIELFSEIMDGGLESGTCSGSSSSGS